MLKKKAKLGLRAEKIISAFFPRLISSKAWKLGLPLGRRDLENVPCTRFECRDVVNWQCCQISRGMAWPWGLFKSAKQRWWSLVTLYLWKASMSARVYWRSIQASSAAYYAMAGGKCTRRPTKAQSYSVLTLTRSRRDCVFVKSIHLTSHHNHWRYWSFVQKSVLQGLSWIGV